MSNQTNLPGAADAGQVIPLRGRIPSQSMVTRARVDRLQSDGRNRAPRLPTPLERAGQTVRRFGLQVLTIAFTLAYFGGAYIHRRQPIAWAVLGTLGVIALVAAIWRLTRSHKGIHVGIRTDVTIALLAAQTAFAVVQVSGDTHSALYPLVYLLAAFFAVAPWPRRISLGLVLTVGVENALRYVCTESLPQEWPSLAVQTGFIGAFALLYHLLMASRLWSARQAEQQAVAMRLREAEEAARGLRLVVADRSRDHRGPGDDDEQARRLLLGAILEVERSVGSIIEGTHLALRGHALALYWLSSDEATISLRDGRSPAGLLAPGPLPAGDGVLGSVLRHSQPVRQCGKIAGVNWYQRSVSVKSVAAVPVIERSVDGTGYVRGVLVSDRLEPEGYDENDIAFLAEIARQISRAVEAERLVGELHRSKEAQDRLQRAGVELNKAATVEEVARAAAKIARELVPALDLAALTRIDTTTGVPVHVVAAAEGSRAKEVDGLVYDDNDGLVAQAARVGAPLPPKAPALLERVKIFDLKLRAIGSLRVVPLAAGGKVIGTLVANSNQRGVLDGEARRRIESLAVLASGALDRALALDQVAQLATTDGLTGIANRRQIDQMGDRIVKEAARYQRPIAAIMTDVDHFKRVNDGYGHAAGDDVLKGLAGILREEARAADLVGRYGGEEFMILLPATDTEGARLFAERLRVRLEAADFATAGGVLRVTASFGVASLPPGGGALGDLLSAADAALYRAKESGRNRVEITAKVQQRKAG